MKIRSLALLSIPPLFLALALAVALLGGRAIRAQMSWGVGRQASGATVALAEFVAASAEEGGPAATSAVLRRIVSYGRIRELAVVSGEGSILVRALAAGARGGSLLDGSAPAAADSTLALGQVWVEAPGEVAGDSLVRAWAPVPGNGERRRVAAVLDVSPLLRAMGTARRRLAWATALTALLGVLAAAYLSRRLAGGLRVLERQARHVVHRDGERPEYRGGVREFSDLASAFETMRSILDDSVARSRRALVARPASPHALAGVLHGLPGEAEDQVVAGRALAVRGVGEPAPGEWVVTARAGSGGVAVAGRAAGGDVLDRAREAGAVSLFLEAALAGAPDVETVLEEARARFRLDELGWMGWTEGDPGPGPEVLHTLPETADGSVAALLTLFAGSPLPELAGKLAGSLAASGSGVLVVVGPVSSLVASLPENP